MPGAERAIHPEALRRDAEALGLAWRGAFHPQPDDAVPHFDDGAPVQTMVLLGSVGHSQWSAFAASPETADGAPDPMDRWSRRVVSMLAAASDAIALFPFQGPPWLPFQRWARRAESLQPSPLGILIHPEYGLWHAYRGALGLRPRLALADSPVAQNPCDSCSTRPCLHACPVGAFKPGRYDRTRCVEHVASSSGHECVSGGCRARRACPIGVQHRYPRDQSEFHMRALIGRTTPDTSP